MLCLVLGFALGQNQVLVNRISNALLSENLLDARQRADDLEGVLVDANLSAQVASSAASSLRDDLVQMRQTNKQLTEEVTFYKSLMAPGSLVKGLQITELELAETGVEYEFRYELLLTQVAQRRSYIAGDIRLDIIGIDPSQDADVGESGEVVLSLTELASLDKYPLKFKFRYFQNLHGKFVLPDGFVPQKILVTAQQQGKTALQQSFPWPQW